MIPIRFGPPRHQLVGIFHPGEPGPTGPAAVLLCNPYGQEAVRTHRMFRVLADRLARAGFSVLRFDYFGTGDSEGEDTEGHLDIWRDDVLLAQEELRRRAPGAVMHWVGARLGATVACLAAAHRPAEAPHGLILWEPLTDGPGYLAEMAGNHQRALAASYSLVPKTYQRPGRNEALGFGMGEALLSQFENLGAQTLPQAAARQLVLITRPGQADSAALASRLAGPETQHRAIAFQHAFDWASEEALNTALVPSEALQLLLGAIQGIPNE